MSRIAIIPARGNSKTIPRKNLQKINGISLLENTIRTAKKSKMLDQIIVSTEDQEIYKIAQNNGVTALARPKELAEDNTPTLAVIKEVLRDHYAESCTVLQCTVPFTLPQDIDDTIVLLLGREHTADTVVEVKEVKTHPYRTWKVDNRGKLKPRKSDFTKYYQRQVLPLCYYNTGGIYTFDPDNIKKYNSIYGEDILPLRHSFPWSIDIDTYEDLELANLIAKSFCTTFGTKDPKMTPPGGKISMDTYNGTISAYIRKKFHSNV